MWPAEVKRRGRRRGRVPSLGPLRISICSKVQHDS